MRNANAGHLLQIGRDLDSPHPQRGHLHLILLVVVVMRSFTPRFPDEIARCDELRKEGNELMRQHKKEEAIALYTAALQVNPCDVNASNNRAQVTKTF